MFIRSSFFSLRLVMETPFMPLYVGRDVSEIPTPAGENTCTARTWPAPLPTRGARAAAGARDAERWGGQFPTPTAAV